MDRIDILIVLAAGIFFMLLVLVFVLVNSQRGKEEKHKAIKKRPDNKKQKQNARSLEANIHALPPKNAPFKAQHVVQQPQQPQQLPQQQPQHPPQPKEIKKEEVKQEAPKQANVIKVPKLVVKQVLNNDNKVVNRDLFIPEEKKQPPKQVKPVHAQEAPALPHQELKKEVNKGKSQVQAVNKQEPKKEALKQQPKRDSQQAANPPKKETPKAQEAPSPSPVVIGEVFNFHALDVPKKKQPAQKKQNNQNQNKKQSQNDNNNNNNNNNLNNKNNKNKENGRAQHEKKLSPEELSWLEFQKKKDQEWEEHQQRERKRKEEEEAAWHDGKRKKKSKPSILEKPNVIVIDVDTPEQPSSNVGHNSAASLLAEQIAKENQEKVARLEKTLLEELERLSVDSPQLTPADLAARSIDPPKKVNSPVAPVFNHWNVQSKVRTFGDEYKRIDHFIKEIESRFALVH